MDMYICMYFNIQFKIYFDNSVLGNYSGNIKECK